MTADTNPKSGAARNKPTFHAVPGVALIELGAAMLDGKAKYGLANWRQDPVAASVYVDAAVRHLQAWWDSREERASDSGVHHLGHVMACMAILLDAQSHGTIVDDRPEAGSFSKAAQRYADERKDK